MASGANGKPSGRDARASNATGGLKLIAPAASPEEAAAIVAALERFMRQTAPLAAPDQAPAPDPWWQAGILEGVEGESPGALREPWMGPPAP